MAKYFIDHPVFACVISIIIALIGIISAYNLPIAQYPQISNPRISVSTNYVGANAEVVEQSVAQAIEKQVNGVDNMIDMNSVSDNSGNYSLNVKFELGTDPDMDSVKVQNRVAQASASLPSEVSTYGVTTKKESAETIMYFALTSPNGTYDTLFMKTYGSTQFVDALKRVKGVSEVSEYGPELAMRIWLDPMKMASLGVTAADVKNAISSQNVQAPAGSIGARPNDADQEFQYSARVKGRLTTADEFGNIIIKNKNGNLLRVKDVARIEFGPRDDSFTSTLNGKNAMNYAIALNTDANALESVAAVKKVLAEAEKNFPPDLKLTIVQDNTDYVRESLKEVVITLVETLVLVVLITWVFLQSWRATLVPTLAIPVSLLGTFGAFIIFDFTINTLTLFALVLAIGIVVDDAIVVVEAVEHNVDELGMDPKEATYTAMREVSGAIVATAFVLLAVFLPVAFLSGITGVLYKQFALSIVVALSISAVVAMSLSPAVCAMVIKPKDPNGAKGFLGKMFGYFNRWLERTTGKYVKNVKRLLRHFKLGLVGLAIVFVLIGMFFKLIPSSYLPDEDQSFAMMTYSLPESASTNRTIKVGENLEKTIEQIPGVKYVMQISGIDVLSDAGKSSAGIMPVKMDDIQNRTTDDLSVYTIIKKLNILGSQTPEANIMAFNQAVLPGLSNTGSLSLYIMDTTGHDTDVMASDVQKVLGQIRQRPEIATIYTTFTNQTPALQFDVDRAKAESLNVPVSSVFTALQANLGGSEVNDFNLLGKTWKVVIQADPKYRGDVKSLSNLYVASNTGALVPLSALVTSKEIPSAPVITRFNGSRGAKIAGSPASGVSTGQAISAIEEVLNANLPSGYTYEWVDQSRDEKAAGSSSFMMFGISLVFVYLCLSALYESWTLPLGIIFAVPSAVMGAVGFQYLRGLTSDIYMQIGMIVLIGLSAKNAILIVEYAKMRVDDGWAVMPALVDTVTVRLRPILMTAFSTVIGAVPLAWASGAGSGSRTSIGTAIIGGMMASTFLSLFLVPVLFLTIEKVFHPKTPIGSVDDPIPEEKK
ncbi:efflux RND transporter permease subunit [Acidaminococcus fermentans]|uniref:efflux RND transporter permease subunit n=1 Tax=Acidaminococcus fermentans TaxID=905 RepID=UPI00242B2116|nr:efflux RND transporter permease subunit [Acidaminococcus fermentans]MDD7195424.1 efflux RND transporter permease subunit [Acidaminococcus fermentans]MDY2852027.1 efflux RND transporter permease subunit [Acidaminococcus fermentans]